MAEFTKTMRKHILLHPMDKKRQQVAVKNALLHERKKYSDKLEGALLDVNNIKVFGDRHIIVDGYLSMEVIADFHVFSPQPGQTLEGVVNKRSRSHLGCLVLDTFNASLAIPPYSEFDPQVGDGCTFVVTEVVVDGEILFLRGTLTSVTSKPAVNRFVQEIPDVLMNENLASDINETSVGKHNSHFEMSVDGLNPESQEDHNKKRKKVKNSPSKMKKKMDKDNFDTEMLVDELKTESPENYIKNQNDVTDSLSKKKKKMDTDNLHIEMSRAEIKIEIQEDDSRKQNNFKDSPSKKKKRRSV